MDLKKVVSWHWLYNRIRQSLSEGKETTFIVPTQFGLTFALMAFVLFTFALGSANNLIYFFVFLLIAVALHAMPLTNKNVDGIKVKNVSTESLFAGQRGRVSLILANESNTQAWDLEFSFKDNKDFSRVPLVNSKTEENISIFWLPENRGFCSIPPITVKSLAPFGLLRAWKYYKPNKLVLVFPALIGQKQFPPSCFRDEQSSLAGLFKDHREFQNSDPVNRIDWRASSRHQQLLIKNLEENEKPALNFHWDQTIHLENLESRLSQLAFWIDEAEKSGHPYSLQIGNKSIRLSQGFAHWKTCLETLALIEPGSL